MLNKEYAPILIPTLNRYDHLKQLIDSLLKCNEAKYTELVIGLDYPPNEKYVDGYKKVKGYIPTIIGFGKVTILETNKNLGFDKNYERLKNYVWTQGYDSYIFSEDDNIFATAFLSYMNWGLNTFKDDASVLAICSYREKDDPIPNYSNNFYKAGGVRPYGFAIWKDRSDCLDKRTDFAFMKRLVDKMPITNVFCAKKLRIACKYLYFFDKKIVHGDFCMGQMCVDENMFCITPVKSLAKNLGSDGSGLHGVDKKRQEKEIARELDTASVFLPVWNENDLHSQSVVLSEQAIVKEHTPITNKLVLRRFFYVFKFLVYKLTGIIISYKQN